MNEFKTMKFVRETRDKMYEETKNKSNEEVSKYYKKMASWLNTSVRKNDSKTIKTKSRP
jgi:DNA phosphorothioation-dependent restriction protein DptG